ncbi:hypothetical protein JOM56_004877 [Amanita muscaria]
MPSKHKNKGKHMAKGEGSSNQSASLDSETFVGILADQTTLVIGTVNDQAQTIGDVVASLGKRLQHQINSIFGLGMTISPVDVTSTAQWWWVVVYFKNGSFVLYPEIPLYDADPVDFVVLGLVIIDVSLLMVGTVYVGLSQIFGYFLFKTIDDTGVLSGEKSGEWRSQASAILETLPSPGFEDHLDAHIQVIFKTTREFLQSTLTTSGALAHSVLGPLPPYPQQLYPFLLHSWCEVLTNLLINLAKKPPWLCAMLRNDVVIGPWPVPNQDSKFAKPKGVVSFVPERWRDRRKATGKLDLNSQDSKRSCCSGWHVCQCGAELGQQNR